MPLGFDGTDQLLTAEEVGRRLRLKPATVYEAAAKGHIPCVRLWEGKRRSLIRFRQEDIERLIRERLVPGEGHAE